MKTMKLRAHIGADGILQIQTPTDLKDTSVEVVLVVQPLPNAEVAASESAERETRVKGGIAPKTQTSRSAPPAAPKGEDLIYPRSLSAQPQHNAWGKPTTKESISNAIAGMRQLRREVALDKRSIRSMIEEGRRF